MTAPLLTVPAALNRARLAVAAKATCRVGYCDRIQWHLIENLPLDSPIGSDDARPSGYTTAAEHWASIPAAYRRGAHEAQPGDLVFYGRGAGHVAMYDGGGQLLTSDAPTGGRMGRVPSTYPVEHWGLTWLGVAQQWWHGQLPPVPPATEPTILPVAGWSRVEAPAGSGQWHYLHAASGTTIMDALPPTIVPGGGWVYHYDLGRWVWTKGAGK